MKNYETIENTSLKEDEKVDIYNLHIEDQLQPSLVDKWGTKLADAKRQKRHLSRKLELKYSELELRIRSDPNEYGWEEAGKKPTEAFIKSAVVSHEEYDALYNEYLSAEYDVDVFGVAVKTIDDKRASIADEVKLHLSGYYSDPIMPKEFVVESRKEVANEIKRKINERRKV